MSYLSENNDHTHWTKLSIDLRDCSLSLFQTRGSNFSQHINYYVQLIIGTLSNSITMSSTFQCQSILPFNIHLLNYNFPLWTCTGCVMLILASLVKLQLSLVDMHRLCHAHLGITCSITTFPCRHAQVVSCSSWHSPL